MRMASTAPRHHCASHDDLRGSQLFLGADNHACRLEALRGPTPCEFTWQVWTREPDRFRIEPSHHALELNTCAHDDQCVQRAARSPDLLVRFSTVEVNASAITGCRRIGVCASGRPHAFV